MMASSRSERIPLPSRNPLPLSATQEAQVKELYYKRVRGYCANEIRDFALCSMNRTISISWACRPQRLAMNSCMVSYATQEEQDAAREEWFATIDERIRQRDEKEKKRREQGRLRDEWFSLPPTLDKGQEGKSRDEEN